MKVFITAAASAMVSSSLAQTEKPDLIEIIKDLAKELGVDPATLDGPIRPADMPVILDDPVGLTRGFDSSVPQITTANLSIEPTTEADSALLELSSVQDYGCWCRPKSDLHLAGGLQHDEVDKACRSYILGNRCIERDFPSCDITQVNYAPYVEAKVDFDKGVLTFFCLSEPRDGTAFDECTYNVCLVELQGLMDQITAVFEHSLQDHLKFENGFNPEFNSCRVSGGGKGGGHDGSSCCGEYPKRYEYKQHGSRRCCQNQSIYNFITHQCCTDGEVRESCT